MAAKTFSTLQFVFIASIIGIIEDLIVARPPTDLRDVESVDSMLSRDLIFLNSEKSRVEKMCSNKYSCRSNWTELEFHLIQKLQDYDLCEHLGMITKCEDLLEEDHIVIAEALNVYKVRMDDRDCGIKKISKLLKALRFCFYILRDFAC